MPPSSSSFANMASISCRNHFLQPLCVRFNPNRPVTSSRSSLYVGKTSYTTQ